MKGNLRVYLTEEVRGLSDFKNSRGKMSFKGMRLHSDKGRLYAMFSNDETVPEQLRDYIENISLHVWMPPISDRKMGFYFYGSAKAEVKVKIENELLMHKVQITGKDLNDIRTLVTKIYRGIQPEENDEQFGTSAEELKVVLGLLSTELGYVMDELKDVHKRHEKFRSSMQSLVKALRKRTFWPWGTSNAKKIAADIERILVCDTCDYRGICEALNFNVFH